MADRGDDVRGSELADRVEEIADSLEHGYNDYAVSVLRAAASRLRGGEGERELVGAAHNALALMGAWLDLTDEYDVSRSDVEDVYGLLHDALHGESAPRRRVDPHEAAAGLDGPLACSRCGVRVGGRHAVYCRDAFSPTDGEGDLLKSWRLHLTDDVARAVERVEAQSCEVTIPISDEAEIVVRTPRQPETDEKKGLDPNDKVILSCRECARRAVLPTDEDGYPNLSLKVPGWNHHPPDEWTCPDHSADPATGRERDTA